jgi:uncharacterized membrane protein YczE
MDVNQIYNLMRKCVSLYFGLFLFAAGMVSNLNSCLGMSPWGVFHVGVANVSGFTLGQVSQIVGFVVLLIGWGLSFAPGFGTFMNMYFVGLFIDLLINSKLIPAPIESISRYALLISSVILIGIGSLFYLRVQLGAGPRDGLMVGLVKMFDKPVWLIRGLIEVSVLFFGYLLGGPVGMGTVITALTTGYAVQLAFKIGKFDGKSRQLNLIELYKLLTGK